MGSDLGETSKKVPRSFEIGILIGIIALGVYLVIAFSREVLS